LTTERAVHEYTRTLVSPIGGHAPRSAAHFQGQHEIGMRRMTGAL
jgi:hypothetical protein